MAVVLWKWCKLMPVVALCAVTCMLIYLSSSSTNPGLQPSLEEVRLNESVLQLIRKKYLYPPSSEPYNLSHPKNDNPSMGQAQIVTTIFKGKTNGFFVECGALDGETRSNTLYFEKHLNWSGLLIEADEGSVEMMLRKHRKAWVSGTCLSTHPYPEEVFFKRNFNQGKIVMRNDKNNKKIVRAQCFPLHYLLEAINVSKVDYFSLDVEGAEFDVLQTIPFEDIEIKVLSVEYVHNKVKPATILEFMEGKGYVMYSLVLRNDYLANDFIFVQKTLLDELIEGLAHEA